MPAQDAHAQRGSSSRERRAVVDAESLVGIVELDDRHRLEVGQHVGQVELAGAVVVLDLGQRLDERLALEAVQPDVELLQSQLLCGRVLALDDLLEQTVLIADHSPIIPTLVVDHGDNRLRTRPTVLIDHPADRLRGQQRRIAVDDEHLAATKLALRDLTQCVGGTLRLALIDELDTCVQMRGYVRMVRVRDHLHVLDACFLDRLEDPVDHRAAAEGMEDFGGP